MKTSRARNGFSGSLWVALAVMLGTGCPIEQAVDEPQAPSTPQPRLRAGGRTIDVPNRPAPPPATVAIIRNDSVNYATMVSQALTAALGLGRHQQPRPRRRHRAHQAEPGRQRRRLGHRLAGRQGPRGSDQDGRPWRRHHHHRRGQRRPRDHHQGHEQPGLHRCELRPRSYLSPTSTTPPRTRPTPMSWRTAGRAPTSMSAPRHRRRRLHRHAQDEDALPRRLHRRAQEPGHRQRADAAVEQRGNFGAGGSAKYGMHHDIRSEIVDHVACRVPDLTLMDAIQGMEGQGRRAARLVTMNMVLASKDPVALDAVACHHHGDSALPDHAHGARRQREHRRHRPRQHHRRRQHHLGGGLRHPHLHAGDPGAAQAPIEPGRHPLSRHDRHPDGARDHDHRRRSRRVGLRQRHDRRHHRPGEIRLGLGRGRRQPASPR